MAGTKDWLGRYRVVLAVVLAAVIVGGAVLVQVLWKQPASDILPTPTLPPTRGPTSTPGPIQVYVSGAVVAPDVYALDVNSIVKDAVLAAGGATEEADLERINLAQPLADGMHVHVPREGEETVPIQAPAVRGGTVLVNINTAAAEELESLPGIGSVLAQSIIEYRSIHGPFLHVDDITQVSGIGAARLEQIRDLITVE